MRNQTAVVLIALILAGALLFEALHPAGWLYPYFSQQGENTSTHKKRRVPIAPPLTAEAYFVTYSNSSYATAWAPQRHALYDGNYFWVILYAGYTKEFFNVSTYPYVHLAVSSPDGKTWSQRQRIVSMVDEQKPMQLGQTFDSRWDDALGKIISFFQYEDAPFWVRFDTANGVLTREALKCWGIMTNYNPVSPRYGYTENRFIAYYQAFHPEINAKRADQLTYTSKDLLTSGSTKTRSGWGGYANDTGQSVTLTWNKTHAIYVTVKNDYTLAWNYAVDTDFTYPPIEFSIKLASGYNTLSGCSEPELNGYGNGTVEIVYIKQSGELCLMSFNGAWSTETVIVASGATCPNIAVAQNGDRYIAYIKQGRIYYRIYNVKTQTLSAEIDLCPTHQYNNVQHLSSNQMLQKGYICYTWTENNPQGPTPYGVWFAALHIP
jgi:hypothetical protein